MIASPVAPPNTVAMVAVPEQVAVPLLNVAEVGAAVAAMPRAVMTRAVPLAMVLVPVSATVAVAVDESLKLVRRQVCVAEPEIEPPEVYVPEATPVAAKYAVSCSGSVDVVTRAIGTCLMFNREPYPVDDGNE